MSKYQYTQQHVDLTYRHFHAYMREVMARFSCGDVICDGDVVRELRGAIERAEEVLSAVKEK